MKIKVKAIPRSKVSYIEENLDGDLRVRLKSAPIDGKANKELVELLSKYYKVSKSQIEIIKGHSSRDKVVEISNEL